MTSDELNRLVLGAGAAALLVPIGNGFYVGRFLRRFIMEEIEDTSRGDVGDAGGLARRSRAT